ncbi:MAG: tripartite tricarboxylate transporter substrate binding protein [Variovorax sp.]|jgi:tripartite-type tricarboxylate transporter receptor subunit TctC|nr:MAG: tripartite tricarboxylate transporter substrate binding protein [Variovorax sp.]
MSRRAIAMSLCALGGLLPVLAGAQAPADGYPTRAITLVVPFAAGGFTDVVARVIAQGMGRNLGQAVVIENRPGAGSTLGADMVAKASPDGYRLLMVSTTHVISDALYKSLPYDPIKGFTPIAKIAEAPYVLLVNAQVPARSVAELVALARAQPGKLDYASSGNGSSQHMMAALFASMAGVQVNHVPYRGSGQAATDLAAGTVQFGFMGTPVAIQQSQAGRTRPLAVTSAKRSSQLPQVPTLDESGLAGYDASVWLGLLAPAGTPPAIVRRLQDEAARVMQAPETHDVLVAAGVEASVLGSADFARLMEADRTKWAKVVKDVGAKVD